ncbi:MAG: DUF6515 family protein [Marinomonas sp.]
MSFRAVLAMSCCLALSGCAGGPHGRAPLGLLALGAGVVIGSVLTTLPHDHKHVRDDIYYSDGVYYQDTSHGYVVVSPPRGIWIDNIPADHKVVRYEDRDYFKAKGVWYRFNPDRKQYRVVDDPF